MVLVVKGGGYFALDYQMKGRGFNFVEAVQTLTGDMGGWKPPPSAVKKDVPKVLLLPEKNLNCNKVMEYRFGRGLGYHRRNHVSLIFQSYNLIDHITPVYESINIHCQWQINIL